MVHPTEVLLVFGVGLKALSVGNGLRGGASGNPSGMGFKV